MTREQMIDEAVRRYGMGFLIGKVEQVPGCTSVWRKRRMDEVWCNEAAAEGVRAEFRRIAGFAETAAFDLAQARACRAVGIIP